MKVLITGGAGYVGTELSAALAARDEIESVTIYDNLSRGNFNFFIGQPKSDKIRFIKADLLDSRTLRSSLEGMDVVVHLAAKVTTPFADETPHIFEQVNNWGTAELVYAIEECASVSRFIFLSSASVYGASTELVDKTADVSPSTFYGVSKMRAERHVFRLLDSATSTLILRCGNVYGFSESMRFDSVINRFMFEANYLNRIVIHGTGQQYRAFIEVARVSDVVTNLIVSDVASGVYDLVETNLTINEIAAAIQELFPALDTIHMDHTFRVRELQVRSDPALSGFNRLPKSSLVDQLSEFRENLAFQVSSQLN